jgi:NADPH-dependent curcumin reductase
MGATPILPMTRMNRIVRLISRPVGEATAENFSVRDDALAELGEGQLLLKNRYVSLDPAMRGWMNEGKSYVDPMELGDTMRAIGIGEVVESKHPKFAVGDALYGMVNVQTWCITDGRGFVKVDPALAPLTSYLNVLGMPGMSAYFGLLEVGQPKEGETVVVSGATGAVGATVGQIAKILGCKTVGIAGGAEKCGYAVRELGYDACIDYKNSDVRKGLKEACPNGIDVYFDNVGGELLDVVLGRINLKARIVICGAISQYNNTAPFRGPANYMQLLVKRARMEGFVVFDHAARFKEAALRMGQWMKEGKLTSKEHVEERVDRFPEVFAKLFRGENFGKLLLKVD